MNQRQRYIPDLQQLGALCEANYQRFTRLLPQLEVGLERVFAISQGRDREAKVSIKIRECHRYTTMLEVSQEGICPSWIQPPHMQVRLYHDANMAEVLSYQNEHRFEGRYQYPNPQMRLPDEKLQLNRFLADWLEHCLHHGHANVSFSFVPNT